MANRQTSPELVDYTLAPSQAPVNDGGFLVVEADNKGRNLIAPADEDTGLPYPIVLRTGTLALHDPRDANMHHHFHPERKLKSSTTGIERLAGLALRNSRMELVRIRDHNHGKGSYHAYFKESALPGNILGYFKTCVYACAGYIPRNGIDMRSGAPEIVELTPKQVDMLKVPSQKDPFGYRNLWYAYEPVRHFFSQFALEQDFTQMNRQNIDKFLACKEESKKQHLARCLIAEAVRLAVDPIKADYRELHKEGMLHPNIQTDPSVMVFFKIGNRPILDRLVPEVEKRALKAIAA